MARAERQKLKLCLTIDLFKRRSDEEHPISVSDIIDYLADNGITAERRSVYRDIDSMRELGYDIVSVHNKRFTYFLANREFETAELKLLVDAVQSSRFITKTKSRELIKKLESLATEYDAEKLQSQVFVANRIKSSNESIYYNVDRISGAITGDRRVSFRYFDWSMKKRRVYRRDGARYCISPWALVWNNENYYMIGYDSENEMIKHYRVDRMTELEAESGMKRDGAAEFRGFDVAAYSKRFFGMYDGELTPVTLRCAKELTNAVIDRFGGEVKMRPTDDEDRFDAEAIVALSPVFYSWVFQFGGRVKIIAPREAAEELREMAKKFE